MCTGAYSTVGMEKPEVNFVESVFSFYILWILGIEFRSPGLHGKSLYLPIPVLHVYESVVLHWEQVQIPEFS